MERVKKWELGIQGAIAAATVALLALAGLALGGLVGAASGGQGAAASSGASAAYIPGDFVSFTCQHGTVTLNGSQVCHDQSNVNVGVAYDGTDWYTMKATADTGYEFSQWSASGDSCLGTHPTCASTSTTNPIQYWGYCALTSKCSGTLTAAFVLAPPVVDSGNWAGYVVAAPANTSVTGVTGSFVVPSISCSVPLSPQPDVPIEPSYVALWAGIDGFTSSTVEQAGVVAACDDGQTSYSAWYEFYPNASVTIPTMTVNPGDDVTVVVLYAPSSGLYTLYVDDGTQNFTITGTNSGSLDNSAECILEGPVSGGGPELANFGTAEFGHDYTGTKGCTTTVGGSQGSFGSFPADLYEVVMEKSGPIVRAEPSALSADGSSFTVTYESD